MHSYIGIALHMSSPAINFSPVNIEQRKKADIRTGDRVRVMQKITEKGKTRLQPFEGLVIARKHGTEPGATFTVRRTTGDYGVEKIFPLYSPNIEKIEILRRSKVRQSNIYHVRRKVAREIRREMRRMRLMDEAVVSEADEQAQAEASSAEATEQQGEDASADTAADAEDTKTAEAPSGDEESQSPQEPPEEQSIGEETKE